MLGAKLEWAKDDAGEIGRIKPFPANEFWISAESFDAAREHSAWLNKGKRRA